MKIIIAAIIAIVLVLSLAACEGEEILRDNTPDFEPFVSGNTDVSKTDEPESEEEKVSMTFKLGPKGETAELSSGDSIGDWVLENLEVDPETSDNVTPIDYIYADFSGSITLEGQIEHSGMSAGSYDFIVSEADLAKLPYIVIDYISENGRFLLNIPAGLENSPVLNSGESLPCRITVSSCRRVLSLYEAFDKFDVTKIEPLGEGELSSLYKDMLINFGGRDREGVLGVAKGASLYFDRNGCNDYSKIDDSTAYSFVMFHSDSEDYIRISVPGIFRDAYAFPEDYFETTVLKYFDTTVEHLRTSDYYYPEQHCYCIGTGGGIGETPALIINNIDENGDTVIFHLTVDYSTQDDYNMALTILLENDGSYKYLSYLPE